MTISSPVAPDQQPPKGKLYRKIALAALACLTFSTPLGAHHSYVMFDRTKTLKVTGVVTQWQWTNPHVYLRLKNPKGGADMVFEGHSPSIYRRAGIGRTITAPGQKVVLTYHPMANGKPGGMMVTINGKGSD